MSLVVDSRLIKGIEYMDGSINCPRYQELPIIFTTIRYIKAQSQRERGMRSVRTQFKCQIKSATQPQPARSCPRRPPTPVTTCQLIKCRSHHAQSSQPLTLHFVFPLQPYSPCPPLLHNLRIPHSREQILTLIFIFRIKDDLLLVLFPTILPFSH